MLVRNNWYWQEITGKSASGMDSLPIIDGKWRLHYNYTSVCTRCWLKIDGKIFAEYLMLMVCCELLWKKASSCGLIVVFDGALKPRIMGTSTPFFHWILFWNNKLVIKDETDKNPAEDSWNALRATWSSSYLKWPAYTTMSSKYILKNLKFWPSNSFLLLPLHPILKDCKNNMQKILGLLRVSFHDCLPQQEVWPQQKWVYELKSLVVCSWHPHSVCFWTIINDDFSLALNSH